MGLRERLGAELFAKVAGPDGEQKRTRIHGTPGPRWFDPASPIGRVHGDASMFVGGIRAILLQTMHPAAMTAVAEHSDYRRDTWGRLANTSTFIATTTFGTEEHAQEAVDIVRAIHSRIRGTLPDGTPYSADDPHLLLWVHVAEIESFLLAHQHYGAHPLDQAGRDEYVAQAGEVAERLGARDVPRSEAELRSALDGFRPELRATQHARDAVDYLIRHPQLPWVGRPAYWSLVAAAVRLLPRWTRAELGLPDLPLVERTAVRALGVGSVATIRWAMTDGRQRARTLQGSRG